MQNDNVHSTAEVSKLTGLTLRQLQWWDETKIAKPTGFRGRCRVYSDIDLFRLYVIRELRIKGMSLAKVGKRLPAINKALGAANVGRYLIVSTKHLIAKTMNDTQEIVTLLWAAPEPLLIIDLSHYRGSK